jgi:hypothetical protein
MRRLWKYVGMIAAALSVVIFLPQAAVAAEGIGAHKGSLLVFPYYDNSGANLTYYRISMDTEVNDVQVSGQIQLHLTYMTPNPAATSLGSSVPPCLEFNRFLDFTLDDYILLNTDQNNRQFDTGWAWAYVVIRRPDATVWKLLWDRFFSDTVYVDTALGVASGWGNYAQFGDADEWDQVLVDLDGGGDCDYSVDIHNSDPLNPAEYNDVCVLEPDDARAEMDDEYWEGNFPDVFYVHYFTEFKRPIAGGPPMDPTIYVMTVIEQDETVGGDYHFPPGPEAEDGDYQWDAEVFNASERPFSTTEQFIICQDILTVHELTHDVTLNNRIPEGFVNIWPVETFRDDPEDLIMVQLENWAGLNNIHWGFYPAHERTTMDVRTELAVGDFDNPPNDLVGGDQRRSDDDDI